VGAVFDIIQFAFMPYRPLGKCSFRIDDRDITGQGNGTKKNTPTRAKTILRFMLTSI
jgi:hypothetical protein